MATTDLERLVVQFSADFKRLENETKRSTAMFNRQLRQMERQASSSVRRINTAFSGVGRLGGAAKGLIAGISAATVKTYIDSALRIENALKVAGLSGEELNSVYDKLYVSAQKNAAPLETLVTLYGRAALVQKELGVSSQELLSFTDNVAVALRVAGTDAQSASGALLQLSQALGSGIVRAEEFNSILEGAQPIAQAAAAGIREAGGSVAKLRQLVVDGKVSSEAFFRGFEAGAPILQEKVSNAVLTIDQRLTNLQTSLIDAAKRFNQSAQASETFGSGIDALANSIDNLDISALVADIDAIISKFAQGEAAARNFAAGIGEALGLDNVGKFLTGGEAQKSFFGGALTITSSKVIQDRISDAFKGGAVEGSAEIDKVLREKYGKGARIASTSETAKSPKANPISLADYAVPVSEKKGRAGGGRSSGRERINEYERELRSINERTAATVAETEALRQLNPLVDDYGYAVEKARTEQDLMNAAQRAGLAITPELRAQIAATADQWAMATAEANKLAEAQDKIRQRAEEWQDTAKDATRGFVDDLIAGKSAAEALANALDKVLNKLLDMVFDDLFTGIFKGGLFSGFSSGGVVKAATGGYISGPGGPRSDSIPAMLSNGEYVINAAATKKFGPLLDAINSGKGLALAGGGPVMRAPTIPNLQGARQSASSGAMRVDVGVSVDNDGNLQAYVKNISQQTTKRGIKAYDKTGPIRLRRDSQKAKTWGVV
ncbi:tape measure protein [Brucella anthropi]|uniref:tape measure protein n=1 Tax=Brucella anthropi TaxID=529 RepID=UPI002448507F|nr:tape measure protein [Brucella anthropi]MDH0367972.1 tape measure protein [Brucella anthropi]